MNPDFKQVLITEVALQARVKEIGALIDERFGNEPITLVGLLKGSYVFIADLARQIKNPRVEVEFMVVSSYKNGESLGVVSVNLDLKTSIANKNVIIIEDIVDTGRTIAKVKELLLLRGAKTVEVAVMCTKSSGRVVSVEIDYPAFEIPAEIVVGYGLDYNEQYRHLPYVAALSKSALDKYKK